MKRLLNALQLFYCVVIILNIIKYELDAIVIVFSVISLILSRLFISNIESVKKDISLLIVFVYFFFSCPLVAAFELGSSERYLFTTYSYQSLASFSVHVMNIMFASSLLFKKIIFRKVVDNNHIYSYINIRSTKVYFLIASFFAITITTGMLGIGSMGVEAGIILPFHLNGIIVILRTVIIPYIFLMIYIRNKNDINIKKYVALMFTWGLLESFFLMSKGFLLILFLPIILYIVIQREGINKSTFIKSLLIIIPFIFLYTVIGNMRYVEGSSSLSEKISTANAVSKNQSEGSVLNTIITRSFSTGSHYMRAEQIIDKSSVFDFSRVPTLLLMQGSERYTTVVIDGYPEWAVHSSGSTGIIDAMLFGGYGLCFIMLIVFVFMAIKIDNIDNRYLPLKLFLYVILFRYLNLVTISIFVSTNNLIYFGSYLFVGYYLYKNSKKYIVYGT